MPFLPLRSPGLGKPAVSPVSKQRPGEARWPAVALRQLLAAIDRDVDAGTFEPPARLDVPVPNQCASRRQREHVRAHAVELLVGHLDELDPTLDEQLDE